MKARLYIRTFLGTSIFFDLLYIYGVAGSLETDYISIRQAIIRGISACVYLGIAVMLHNRLIRDESMGLSKKRLNRLKRNDKRGIWQKLKEDRPILNETIQWGITIIAFLAFIKSFIE